MSGLLRQSLKKPDSTDKQLAKPFNYGAPFSAKYRSWLHKCGITEMGLPMKLTPGWRNRRQKGFEIQDDGNSMVASS